MHVLCMFLPSQGSSYVQNVTKVKMKMSLQDAGSCSRFARDMSSFAGSAGGFGQSRVQLIQYGTMACQVDLLKVCSQMKKPHWVVVRVLV